MTTGRGASLNARRLGTIDRPVASPYSTSEIPGLFVTTTIHRRLLNVDPAAAAAAEARCGFVVATMATQDFQVRSCSRTNYSTTRGILPCSGRVTPKDTVRSGI